MYQNILGVTDVSECITDVLGVTDASECITDVLGVTDVSECITDSSGVIDVSEGITDHQNISQMYQNVLHIYLVSEVFQNVLQMYEEEAVDTCRNGNYCQGDLRHWIRGCCRFIIKTCCDLTERFPLWFITQGGSHSLPCKDNLFLHTKLDAPMLETWMLGK